MQRLVPAAIMTLVGVVAPSCGALDSFGKGGGGTSGGGSGGDGGGGNLCIPANEVCDGADNDCDGEVDENCTFWGDTCPTTGVALAPPVVIDLYANTSEATGGTASLCHSGPPDLLLGNDSPEYVYELDIESAGSLVILVKNVPGSSLNAVLYMRSVCEEEASRLWCRDVSSDREIYYDHVEAGTYYLFVDGRDGASGDYSLSIVLTEPVCGDGVVNPVEQCDDGNFNQADGCDQCQKEAPDPPDTCDATDVPLQLGQELTLQGTTINLEDDLDPPSGCSGGLGGRDRVYHVVPAANGSIEASVGFEQDGMTATCSLKGGGDPGCWDRVLYVRSGDCAVGTDVACSNGQAFQEGERVTFDVVADGDYYVIVDGHDATQHAYGSYNLQLKLTP